MSESAADSKASAPKNDTIRPEEDTSPAMMLGLQALLGTVWWIVTFFVYIGTNATDQLSPKSPIVWFWKNLDNTTLGWVAASYFATFIAYLVVSFMELLAWLVYVFGHPQWMMIWTPIFGYWGSLIVYIIPWGFALLHLDDPNSGTGFVWGFCRALCLQAELVGLCRGSYTPRPGQTWDPDLLLDRMRSAIMWEWDTDEA